MSKAARLRPLLTSPRVVLAGGVYDGLSGILAEKAGFDALWASGFCISAARRLPDMGIVTMTEHLSSCIDIDRATSLPVIADVDDGFGDALVVQRMVRDYEAAGVAAVCIEDNQHPKRSSLYSDVGRELVDPMSFANKIRAAKEAQVTRDFVVIARIEALVAKMGMEEALHRAHTYADAGADMILIHSTIAKPDQVLEFGSRWKRPIPLVAVPTTYPTVKLDDLAAVGFRMAIFANQGMRAAISAMEAAFGQMVAERSLAQVESQVAPLSKVFSLVGLEAVRQQEARYIGGQWRQDRLAPSQP